MTGRLGPVPESGCAGAGKEQTKRFSETCREQKQGLRPAFSVPEPILRRGMSLCEGAVPPGSLPCGGLLRSILCGKIRLDLGLGFLSTHALIHVVLDGLLEHRGLGLLSGLGG